MFDIAMARVLGKLPGASTVISLCPSILTVVAAIAAKPNGALHLVVVHDIPSGLGSAVGGAGRIVLAILRRLEAWSLNRVDHLIVLSTGMERQIRALGVQTSVTVLPPHVNTKAIFPVARRLDHPPTLMYSGNLGRKQGLGQILDMAAILKVLAPDVQILIRGDGSEKSNLLTRVRQDALNNVRLEPLAAKADLSASLGEGDVHLIPQLPAGGEFAVPSKAFAIMAAGRPFVATTDADSPLALLAEASGACVCVPPSDPHALASAALELLSNSALRATMGARGRDYAEKNADTQVVMSKFAALLARQSPSHQRPVEQRRATQRTDP